MFVSGSQGEPLSALSMISLGEHRDVAAGPGDTVVLSARAIPGNERGVSRLISNLYRLGCDVVHPGTARVHVSGHGSRDDLVELLQRTRPRYLVPVHGEYRMLAQHARLAAQAGLPADRVLVAEDGDVLSLSASGARREARVAAGRVLLDRGGASEIEDVVVRDRRHLSSEGIVVPIVVVDRQTGQLESPPEIVTRGIVDTAEAAELAEEAGRILTGSDGRTPGRGAARLRAHARAREGRAAALLQAAHPAPPHGHPGRDGGLEHPWFPRSSPARIAAPSSSGSSPSRSR